MKQTILRYGLMALVLLIASSCSNDMTEPIISDRAHGGHEKMVDICISAIPMSGDINGSRSIPEGMNEGTAPDYMVEDFWLMEYSDGGILIGTPQYYRSSDLIDNSIAIPLILPDNATTKYTCVIVANTHSEILSSALGDTSTLDKLKALFRKVAKHDDMYLANKDLLMNCVIPVTASTTRLDCKLYRNVAKLTLKLTNRSGSNVKINTVQVCNLPDHQFYADRLYDGAQTPSPTTMETDFISFEAEKAEIDEGGEQTLAYYLPRNCRGKNTTTLENQKNTEAPNYATYVEIMAEDKTTGTPLRYRLYPGENMTNDFNITPNRHYTMPITIAGKGNAMTDSRVKDMGEIQLPESNSYIVNPLNGDAQTLHCVPITRINRFWESIDGQAINSEGKQEDNIIKDNTEWVAEVIWQDQPQRLINFCDEKGSFTDGNTHYNGRGMSCFRFKPIAGRHGNVVIGVRKASAGQDAYLWSWHLWITDYNPDRKAAWQDGIYAYGVEGGQVHRYENTVWNNKYKNKYIMDRNLGAMSANGNTDDEYKKSCGLYYQFGRKDPFPSSQTLIYNINGEPLKPINWAPTADDCIEIVYTEATHLYQSVKRPYTFFSPSGDWLKPNSYGTSIWNNPDWYSSDTNKSIFDPSPPGWKIPDYRNIWDDISHIMVDGSRIINAIGFAENKGAAYKNGWYMYMGGYQTGETAWYPGASCRAPKTAFSFNPRNTNGYYYYTSIIQSTVYPINVSSISFNTNNSCYRRAGSSIRCIQE